MSRLAGKVAVVTGGGRNVGEAIALRFAREGAKVAVVDLDKDRAQRTVDLVEQEVPGAAAAFVCDVSESASVQEMATAVAEAFGGVDILVNNVAITDRGATVLDLDEDEWDRVLKVTLTSVFLCTKYVGKQIVETGRGGAIVNIGSTSGYRARPNATAYPAAKAAVINLTRSFAAQLAPYGIRANSVTPNKVGSPVGQDVEPTDRKRSNLVGRGGRPEDIADAVLFMASEESSFITATDLLVDGGVPARADGLIGTVPRFSNVGGVQGFGPIDTSDNHQPFDWVWQARVWAMNNVLPAAVRARHRREARPGRAAARAGAHGAGLLRALADPAGDPAGRGRRAGARGARRGGGRGGGAAGRVGRDEGHREWHEESGGAQPWATTYE